MPDAPPRSFLLHLFLEAPLPLIIGLTVVGLIFLYRGATEGLLKSAGIGAGLLAAAAAVYGIARVVVTEAEHGERTVESFVRAVEADDVAAADGLLAPDATVHMTRESNPGAARRMIINGISRLHGSYSLESARITMLDGWADPDRDGAAIVHLRVSASTGDGFATPTGWRLRVARNAADEWQITRMTWVDMLGRTPPGI